MRPSERQPISRYKSFYFISFNSIGILIVYMNLYLKRSGMTDSQLGTAAAIPSLMMGLSPLFWGYLADSVRDMRKLLPILFVGAAITFTAMLASSNYYYLLLMVVLTSFFYTPTVPIAEAIALNYIGKHGGDYGRIRLWGSLGVIMSMLISGLILKGKTDKYSGEIGFGLLPVILYFVFFRLLGAVWSFVLPRPEGTTARKRLRFREIRDCVTPNLVVALAIAFIARAAMQAYYVFFSIYLDELSVPDNAKGMFWAMGVASEVGMLFLIGIVIERIGVKRSILLGFAGMVVRLFLYSLRPPIWWILPVQAFHSLTFTAFHVGMVNFMSRSLPERARASGQALYNSVVWGLGGVFGSKICGEISSMFDLFHLFRYSSYIALLALILGAVCIKEPPVGKPEAGDSRES